MKVLLLGINGMLGQAIKKQLKADGIELYGVDREEADFCFDLLNDEKINDCIKSVHPDVLINTAAIVNLDLCERDPGAAYCLNSRLPGVLANLCNQYLCYFVHISTDQYYSGDMDRLHKETAPVKLVNEYARTKYIGEQMALTCNDALVLRTNIVGFRGRGQKTFLEWAISEAENRRQMTLFTDFYTSSIHTVDFAKIFLDVLKMHPTGVYNLASSEAVSKKAFILGLTRELFHLEPNYIDGSVKNIHGTSRGESLGLDTGKIEKLLGYQMPNLAETLKSIKREYEERKIRNEL